MRSTTGFALAISCLVAAPAFAQQLDLPRPSPNAKVSQFIGLTEVGVEYSSPGVKGRKVFPDVVPYDKVWRTGANSATKVTFSKDVVVGDKTVPAGSYSLFTVPGKTSWTVILNKNATASTAEYKQDFDMVRVQVTPRTLSSPRERLAFGFSDFNNAGGNLDMEWDNVRVSLPIKVTTDEQVDASLKAFSEGAWRPWTNAARYELEQRKDYDKGMTFVDKSIQMHEDWFNLWTKAQLLAAKGNHKEARVFAEKAKTMGDKNPDGFFFADEVKKALLDWKK